MGAAVSSARRRQQASDQVENAHSATDRQCPTTPIHGAPRGRVSAHERARRLRLGLDAADRSRANRHADGGDRRDIDARSIGDRDRKPRSEPHEDQCRKRQPDAYTSDGVGDLGPAQLDGDRATAHPDRDSQLDQRSDRYAFAGCYCDGDDDGNHP